MKKKNITKDNRFSGCTIVATGKLENFTRDSINSKIATYALIIVKVADMKSDASNVLQMQGL